MSTVPDVGVCCKVTITHGNSSSIVRYVDAGTLGEVIEDALHITGRRDWDADEFWITVKREGHDA